LLEERRENDDMEVDHKMIRDLQKKFDLEMNKREIEITENWRKDLEAIYKKKYENVNALLSDMKNLMDRMSNRANTLTRMVKEGV
jgi:mRNA-degrading endonuclease YafQ of YafQ-DinJ toxin-antitoxin module